jgi:hypothetical protein
MAKNYHDYDDASDYEDDDSDYDDVDFRDPTEDGLLRLPDEIVNDQLLPAGFPRRNEQDELAQLLELSRRTHEEETLKRLKTEAEKRPVPTPVIRPALVDDFDEQMRRIMEESMKTLKEDEEKRKNKKPVVVEAKPVVVPIPQMVIKPVLPQPTEDGLPHLQKPTVKKVEQVAPPVTIKTVEHEKQTANPPTNKPHFSIIKSYQEKILQIRGYDEKIKQLDEMFAPKLAEYFETSVIDKIVLDEVDSKLYLDVMPFIRISKETRDFFASIVETTVVTAH